MYIAYHHRDTTYHNTAQPIPYLNFQAQGDHYVEHLSLGSLRPIL